MECIIRYRGYKNIIQITVKEVNSMTDSELEEEIVQHYCNKCRGKPTTVEYILNDTKECNFCDVPYIILEEIRKEV